MLQSAAVALVSLMDADRQWYQKQQLQVWGGGAEGDGGSQGNILRDIAAVGPAPPISPYALLPFPHSVAAPRSPPHIALPPLSCCVSWS